MSYGQLSQKAALITTSKAFNRVVIGAILFSSILLGIEADPELSRNHTAQLKLVDQFVLGFFVLELALKIFARGSRPWAFFSDPWNVADFLIVAACLMPSGSGAFAVFRLIRVLRILRLVTAVPRLQIIVSALLKSVPSISYVVVLLSIHLYMFGVLGTFLFAANDPVHFGSLAKTFMSLFQILTLEGWADMMKIQIYGCQSFGYESFPNQCVSPTAQPFTASLYFVSFIVIGTMIILNLLIGVVVGSLADSQKESERGQTRPEENLGTLAAELGSLREELRRHNAYNHPKTIVDDLSNHRSGT